MNSEMQILLDEYPGDVAWGDFSSRWEQCWLQCTSKQQLFLAVRSDLRLAQTVYGIMGEHALQWLKQPIPALGGRTPASCLQVHAELLALRSCLMRMPL
jgi:Protein of unknown function (DUF2384)